MLDFPGKVSAVVFTQGCNFVCPYCHNPELVTGTGEQLRLEDILSFLTQRKAVLQGVVISGGEPTLHNDLPDFCASLRSLGYAVKLDTNGSNPEMLGTLLHDHLLDYVAMDIKAAPGGYTQEIAPGQKGNAIARCMDTLNASQVPHEFRIPCAAPFINAAALEEILAAVRPGTSVFLQAVRLGQVLRPFFFQEAGRPLEPAEMAELARQAERLGHTCSIR